MTPMDPMPPVQGDVLDADTIQQLIDLDDGGLGLLQEMYEIFRDDTPSRIEALEVAVRAGQREEMGDIAHAIKGASATIGASQVRALSLALETAGRKGDSGAEPAVLVSDLKLAFQQALKALGDYLASNQQ